MIDLRQAFAAAAILLCGAVTCGGAGASPAIESAPPADTVGSGRLAFQHVNADAVLTRRGTRLSTTAPDVVATGFARAPLKGRAYVEAVVFHGGRHAAGVSLWGDPQQPVRDTAHPGRSYGRAGASVQAVSAWMLMAYANYGLPSDTKMEVTPLSGAPGQRLVVQLAVDAGTRAVWVKLSTAGGWAGGGDPAAGTRPSFVLDGASPILVGGNVSNPANYVEILAADQHVGVAPSGFSPYG